MLTRYLPIPVPTADEEVLIAVFGTHSQTKVCIVDYRYSVAIRLVIQHQPHL